jgi:hypothetical protein
MLLDMSERGQRWRLGKQPGAHLHRKLGDPCYQGPPLAQRSFYV